MEHVFLSPAKVNLFLKVVSRRPDGYHNLVSIVDLISLYDVIHVEERSTGRGDCRGRIGTLAAGPDNTIYRAIMLLKETIRCQDAECEVLVEKKIPMGAGLGGGSSNAATMMKELVRLWNLRASG